MMSNATIGPASSIEMSDFEIPREQILEGNPVAKIWINAQSADKTVTQGVWQCTAGRFTWEHEGDDFVMLLEGEVVVTDEGGDVHTLRAGDFGFFPNGMKTTWQVDQFLKKTFTLRTAGPLEL